MYIVIFNSRIYTKLCMTLLRQKSNNIISFYEYFPKYENHHNQLKTTKMIINSLKVIK